MQSSKWGASAAVRRSRRRIGGVRPCHSGPTPSPSPTPTRTLPWTLTSSWRTTLRRYSCSTNTRGRRTTTETKRRFRSEKSKSLIGMFWDSAWEAEKRKISDGRIGQVTSEWKAGRSGRGRSGEKGWRKGKGRLNINSYIWNCKFGTHLNI